jgi:hypothetical protein
MSPPAGWPRPTGRAQKALGGAHKKLRFFATNFWTMLNSKNIGEYNFDRKQLWLNVFPVPLN